MAIDLFAEEKPKPCVYVADLHIKVIIPSRSKKNPPEIREIKLEKHPFILDDKHNLATEKQKQRVCRAVYDRFIHKGEFDKIIFQVGHPTNVKFLSKVSYNFDYNID